MADDAKIKFGGDTTGLDRELSAINRKLNSWGRVASGIVAGALTFKGITGLIDIGQDFVSLANEQAKAETKLAAVLRATGNAAGFSAGQLKKMAADMQEIAGVGDEVIINSQAVLATFTQIKGDQFKEATEAALDMSAVLGGDLQNTVVQLGKALNDPVKGINALARSGVSFNEQQRETIKTMVEAGDVVGAQTLILEELKNEFGGAAEAMSAGFGGQVRKLQNTLGDLGEVIGFALIDLLSAWLPVAEKTVEALTFLANKTTEWSGALTDLNEGAGQKTLSWFDELINSAIEWITVTEVVWEKFDTAVELATVSAGLQITRLFDTIGYFFGTTLPAYLEWFGENWTNMFVDTFNFTITVLENMKDNLGNFFLWLSNALLGTEYDFEFKGLTDGFESSLQKLPEIAERQMSLTERILQARLDALADDLGSAFANKLEENQDLFENGTEIPEGPAVPFKAGLGVDAPALGNKAPKVESKSSSSSRGISAPDSSPTGVEGAEALFNRIRNSASKDQTQERTARAAETTNDLLRELNDKFTDNTLTRAEFFATLSD